jgi:hypothetical protein
MSNREEKVARCQIRNRVLSWCQIRNFLMLDWLVKIVGIEGHTLVLGESKRLLVIDLFKAARKVCGANEQREESSNLGRF